MVVCTASKRKLFFPVTVSRGAAASPKRWHRRADPRLEIYALNVDPDCWGQGCGRALLDAGVSALARAGFSKARLWVHPGNKRARDFYERAGWVVDGAEREQEVLGVQVPEVRYRLSIAP